MSEEFEMDQAAQESAPEPVQESAPEPQEFEASQEPQEFVAPREFDSSQRANTIVVDNSRKKSSWVSDLLATLAAVTLFYLFGLVGGALCAIGYAIVRKVVRSPKLSVAAKVILAVVLTIVFLVLLVVYIFVAALWRADML